MLPRPRLAGVPTDHRREILRLAIPAFLALVAEPLFLLADSAIVGHLGTTPLAGLGVASAVLLTATNIFVFLAYGTTAVVARRTGARDQKGALAAGIDGMWLALLLGLVATAVVVTFAAPLVEAFGASAAAVDQGVIYLRISAFAIPPTSPTSVVKLLGHEVVLTSTGAEAGGPGPTASHDPLALRQRLLSEAALRLEADDTAPLVVTLPTVWRGEDAASFFTDL